MNRRLVPLALLASTLLATPLYAKPAPTIAGAIADPARNAKNRALDEGRKPAEVLAFAGIKPGDVVADYQAGGGYYSELIADLVGPKGRVYAMTQPNFYDRAGWDPIQAAHSNIAMLVAPGESLVLPPRSVDVIFAHLTWHDLYWTNEKYQHPKIDVARYMANWFAAVKPGGRVVIVDHVGPAGDPREVVDKFHRIDPAQVKADMIAAGFVLDGESDVLHRSEDDHTKGVFDPSVRGKTDRFVLRFRRP